MAINPEVHEYNSLSGTEIHAVFDTVKFGDLHMVKYATQRDVANIHVMGRVDSVGTGKGKRQTSGACVFTVFDKDRLLEAINKNPSKQIFLTNHELLNYGDSTTNPERGVLLRNAFNNARRFNTINPDIVNGELSTFQNSTSIFDVNSYGDYSKIQLADQIPPFDITLVGISEVSPETASRMVIHGVQFTSDSGGTSIDDLVLERQLTFIARRISPWKRLSDLTVQDGKIAK